MLGSADYTLARRAVLRDLQKGALTRSQVCDAHPDLMRAGANIGIEREGQCPVCGEESLRELSYVYGDSLRKRSGQVVYPEGALTEMAERYDEFRCYVVEVCIDCSWNHLVACHLMGRRKSASEPDSASAD